MIKGILKGEIQRGRGPISMYKFCPNLWLMPEVCTYGAYSKKPKWGYKSSLGFKWQPTAEEIDIIGRVEFSQVKHYFREKTLNSSEEQNRKHSLSDNNSQCLQSIEKQFIERQK